MEGCIGGGGEDLISKLPDDILVHMLSLLAPKEVISCGVLSRRWTTLPKLVPMTLKFVSKAIRRPLIEETKFIREVNQILDSGCETLSELSICFHFCEVDQHSHFDKWVRFAIAKKVRKISLDLYGFMGGFLELKYQFPHDVGLSRCTSLTDLRLESVNVTNKQIILFLECCPLLESLCVISSDSLESLKVEKPIRLKFLEIQYCDKLHVFEISAPNLISFKYIQDQMNIMPLKCPPQLNELSLSGYDFIIDNLHLFTSYFAQIVTLLLDVDYYGPEFRWPIGIPTLRSLKYLTIHYKRSADESFLCFGSWIQASPLLRRFIFKEIGWRHRPIREAVKPRMYPHQLLKEVEIVGFKGDVLDTELVMYIIENAVNLDKIVFDCRNPLTIGTPRENTPSSDKIEIDQRLQAGVHARKFESMLRAAAKFVLIP